jgi:hypothetical protein
MATKFRRSKTIAPGVKVNLNKKSASITVGGKRGRITAGTSGKVTTGASIPGTGVYWSESSGGASKSAKQGAFSAAENRPENETLNEGMNDVFASKSFWLVFTAFCVIGAVVSLASGHKIRFFILAVLAVLCFILFAVALFSDGEKEIQENKCVENAGMPYSSYIPPKTRWGTPISYDYQNVCCTIAQDISNLQIGSVVYLQVGGTVINAEKKYIADIDNPKICNMVTDYINRGDTITARVSKIGEKLAINIGFYREPDDDEDDEDDN